MWTDRDTLILMGFWMFPALCVIGGMLACWLRGHPFCRHDWQWKTNWYGDQIPANGWNRSAWQCRKCGTWKNRPELYSANNGVTVAPTPGGA
jgi:hypothetical protein